MFNRLIQCVLAVATGLTLSSAGADALDDAHRLLEVAGTGDHFESVARKQTRDIIRSYTLIVHNSVDVTLPETLRQELARCYARVYDWANFRSGIARILATTLSQKQMQLLIDFYRSRGLPPTEIDTFKATIALAEEIEKISADFIYRNSASCVESDARLILGYLHGKQALTGHFPPRQH